MSNAWVIYPLVWDNLSKGGLIPDDVLMGHLKGSKGGARKELSLEEEPASD